MNEMINNSAAEEYIFPETHWAYGLERNQRVWKLAHSVFLPILRRKLQFNCTQFRVRSKKYLVLSNHATDYDSFMLAMMFSKYLRFVVPDRFFKSKFIGSAANFLFNPIPKHPNGIDSTAERYIKTNLSLGINVAMFAEEARTMNGRTGPISSDLGRIVKESEGGLVTVRLARGYMVSPLWAYKKRSGPTTGRVVHEYSREELDTMTVDEINAAIAEDLRYDVWEDQDAHRIVYKCKEPAAGMENALFVCPECKRIGYLKGKGSDIMCRCGFSLSLDKYGFFSNKSSQFHSLLDWDLWQKNYLASTADMWKSRPEEIICTDRNIKLFSVENGKSKAMLDSATMTLYPDKIQFSAGEPLFSFNISEIDDMNTYNSRSLLFICQGRHYEITKKAAWPVLRYVAIWRLLTQK